MKKKILIVITVIVFTFSSLYIPKRKAEALAFAPLLVNPATYTALGSLLLKGATIVTGGLVAYDSVKKAYNLWYEHGDDVIDTVKNAINLSYDYTKNKLKATVNYTNDVIQSISDKFNSFVRTGEINQSIPSYESETVDVDWKDTQINITTDYPQSYVKHESRYYSDYNIIYANDGYSFTLTDEINGFIFPINYINVQWDVGEKTAFVVISYSKEYTTAIYNYFQKLENYVNDFGRSLDIHPSLTYLLIDGIYAQTLPKIDNVIHAINEQFPIQIDLVKTETAENLYQTVIDSFYNREFPSIDNSTDVYIPAPRGILREDIGDIPAGTELVYNPSDELWETKDGIPISTDIPDTAIGVLNPSLDVIDTGTITVGYDVPIDVTTGETVTVGNPSIPGETVPPDDDTWRGKFGSLVTTQFPFSLPWDLYYIYSFLAHEPVKPKFDVDTSFMGIPIKFSLNLDVIDSYMPFVRNMIKIGFALFLILATRRLLGGGV